MENSFRRYLFLVAVVIGATSLSIDKPIASGQVVPNSAYYPPPTFVYDVPPPADEPMKVLPLPPQLDDEEQSSIEEPEESVVVPGENIQIEPGQYGENYKWYVVPAPYWMYQKKLRGWNEEPARLPYYRFGYRKGQDYPQQYRGNDRYYPRYPRGMGGRGGM
eukprot:GHVQ01000086.1.p1 GENE.GHVQ01000086.1~~GHVQ01000086.1.p1  ORF type:complete len:172 (-),score=29.28 GHVQ01000086.1:261-746(-)